MSENSEREEAIDTTIDLNRFREIQEENERLKKKIKELVEENGLQDVHIDKMSKRLGICSICCDEYKDYICDRCWGNVCINCGIHTINDPDPVKICQKCFDNERSN